VERYLLRPRHSKLKHVQTRSAVSKHLIGPHMFELNWFDHQGEVHFWWFQICEIWTPTLHQYHRHLKLQECGTSKSLLRQQITILCLLWLLFWPVRGVASSNVHPRQQQSEVVRWSHSHNWSVYIKVRYQEWFSIPQLQRHSVQNCLHSHKLLTTIKW
jgi:hypothetical protein